IDPTALPNVKGKAKGIMTTNHMASRPIRVLGPWYGWAVLALKKPPPLSPKSSMGCMLATGPPGMVWVAMSWPLASTPWAATVVTVRDGWKFWITPWLMNTKANTKEIGSRMRVVERIMSTQKLPSVRCRRRMMARVKATATAMPTAADTYWCSTSASIWLRWLIVDSPAYACQLVLVKKLTAVLKLNAGLTAES